MASVSKKLTHTLMAPAEAANSFKLQALHDIFPSLFIKIDQHSIKAQVICALFDMTYNKDLQVPVMLMIGGHASVHLNQLERLRKITC